MVADIDMEHFLTGRLLRGPYPSGFGCALFGMGCFWGAERIFWVLDGVWLTSVGYGGGDVSSPSYDQVCSGVTGHAELVLVVYDGSIISYSDLLGYFWEGHDPTQYMRQGNDIGSQYRSCIFCETDDERDQALSSRDIYGSSLLRSGYGSIVTEILPWCDFWFAESYHQQYLARHPGGYCGLGGTGISFRGIV